MKILKMIGNDVNINEGFRAVFKNKPYELSDDDKGYIAEEFEKDRYEQEMIKRDIADGIGQSF